MSSFIIILLGAVMGFLVYNGAYNFVNGTGELISRITGNTFYTAFYRLPWGNQAAAVWFSQSSSDGSGGVPVLLYHGTPPEGNDNPPLPQNIFVEQMRALHDDGWHTITLDQFEQFMQGKITLPPKSFLLTFDDGRKESFYPVDPVLKDLGFNAVMFVITGFSLPDDVKKTSNFYLSKSELAFMADSGRWELESHGDEDHRLYDVPTASSTGDNLDVLPQNRFLSNKFWRTGDKRLETNNEYTKRVTDDLIFSKQKLENAFGKKVTAFAFPFNDYGQDTVNFADAKDILSNVVKAQFMYAFYQIDPSRDDPFNYADPNAYMVKRIEPVASWSGDDLRNMLNDSAPRPLPYTSDTFTTDWSSNWGKVTRSDNTLHLRSTPDTTGAAGLLNGSRLWHDYEMTISAKWNSGSHLSLISRYQTDSKSFLSCAFSTSTISLVAHINKEQQTIEATPYNYPTTTGTFEASMKVDGNRASCSAYGKTVSSAVKPSYVHSGSLGIQIWSAEPNAASLDVEKVTAHAL